MRCVPLTLRVANEFVSQHHRHSRPTTGHKWSIGLEHDSRLVGVAIVGRPVARLLNSDTTAEVLRVCVLPDAPKGACSKLYQACWRAWREMGGLRILTYTLTRESGASLRGAGWECVAECGGGGWSRKNRKREDRQIYLEPKYRWERKEPTP